MALKVLLESLHQVCSLPLFCAAVNPDVSSAANPIFQHLL
eukprot:CAMPEP_0114647130 /NCGR_PEP_ID=MMETSP0191-20121206/5590_1 /TAXON_ID=126664 /ORGANISM="Sorites sp." /LENGTH=39 /DNA_ID= /DNA_START= /DNA_END= /DNA_ORIENTATION=